MQRYPPRLRPRAAARSCGSFWQSLAAGRRCWCWSAAAWSARSSAPPGLGGGQAAVRDMRCVRAGVSRTRPARGGGRRVVRHTISLGTARGGYYDRRATVAMLLYLPPGEHPPKSLPCILITGAGSTLLAGVALEARGTPEYLPYVEAGFAVLVYELDGPTGDRRRGRHATGIQRLPGVAGRAGQRPQRPGICPGQGARSQSARIYRRRPQLGRHARPAVRRARAAAGGRDCLCSGVRRAKVVRAAAVADVEVDARLGRFRHAELAQHARRPAQVPDVPVPCRGRLDLRDRRNAGPSPKSSSSREPT